MKHIRAYVVEYDDGTGNRVFWPETLPKEVARAAAKQMKRDGLSPRVVRLRLQACGGAFEMRVASVVDLAV